MKTKYDEVQVEGYGFPRISLFYSVQTANFYLSATEIEISNKILLFLGKMQKQVD